MLGRKIPPNLNLLVGSADHEAIQVNMAQKVESYRDLPVKEVAERFGESLERKVEESGGLAEIEVKEGPRIVTDKVAKQRLYDVQRSDGHLPVVAYHQKVGMGLQPELVEHKFSVEVPHVPVPLIGYIDLVATPVQQTMLEQTRTIIERKRRFSSRRKPEPEWTMQGEVYQLAVPAPYDFHISALNKASVSILTPASVEELRVPLAPRERSLRLVEQIVAEIGFYYRRFGPDEPWPAKGKLHPWACNYCGFREGCWGWK